MLQLGPLNKEQTKTLLTKCASMAKQTWIDHFKMVSMSDGEWIAIGNIITTMMQMHQPATIDLLSEKSMLGPLNEQQTKELLEKTTAMVNEVWSDIFGKPKNDGEFVAIGHIVTTMMKMHQPASLEIISKE